MVKHTWLHCTHMTDSHKLRNGVKVGPIKVRPCQSEQNTDRTVKDLTIRGSSDKTHKITNFWTFSQTSLQYIQKKKLISKEQRQTEAYDSNITVVFDKGTLLKYWIVTICWLLHTHFIIYYTCLQSISLLILSFCKTEQYIHVCH